MKRMLPISHRSGASSGAPALAIALAMLAAPAAGQAPSTSGKTTVAANRPPAAKTWVAPRTPDGRPDLQGVWTNVTMIPFERPKELADKQFFTEEEAAAFEKRTLARRDEAAGVAGDGIVDKHVWWEQVNKVNGTRRTSMVFDPPDGRVPPLTAEARKAAATRAEALRRPATGPEDRSVEERCILWSTAGPPMMPAGYNSNYQIFQSPGYVVILNEMIHDVRIVPLDGRPHVPQNVRQWLGDSRGRWEGDTLVVDTTNFTDQTHFRGADRNLHLIERFTRTDPETIVYQFTVDDPTAFAKAWTAEAPLNRTPGPIYEFACHEGNRAMANILKTARQADRAAEVKK